MKDNIIKFKMLIFDVKRTYYEWKESVWKVDLDEYDCCQGYDCACGGHTLRDSYYEYYKKFPL